MTLQSATLLGSSSGRNAGDAALISGIMEAVDDATGTSLLYEIPTIKPSYIRDNYPNSRTQPVSMMPWSLSVKMFGVPTYRSVMQTDVTLIFDAILFDRALYNPLFNFMSTLYLLLPRAKKLGKRMGFYDVGTGPVNTPHGQKMLRELSHLMDFITVRDQASYDILKDIGVEHPRMFVAADAALNLRASDDETALRMLDSVGLSPDEEILGVNVNVYLDTWAGPGIAPMGREKFVQTYAAALNRVGKELGVPLLFVCTQHMDVDLTRDIMDRVHTAPKKAILTNVDHNHYDVKAALSKVNLLFGMRLHCMILASGALTPIIGLAYQPKNDHYFTSLGLKEYCMGFEGFSEEALFEHIRKGWSQRHELRAQLESRIPVLQERARLAAQLVAAMHRDEDLDQALLRLQKA